MINLTQVLLLANKSSTDTYFEWKLYLEYIIPISILLLLGIIFVICYTCGAIKDFFTSIISNIKDKIKSRKRKHKKKKKSKTESEEIEKSVEETEEPTSKNLSSFEVKKAEPEIDYLSAILKETYPEDDWKE